MNLEGAGEKPDRFSVFSSPSIPVKASVVTTAPIQEECLVRSLAELIPLALVGGWLCFQSQNREPFLFKTIHYLKTGAGINHHKYKLLETITETHSRFHHSAPPLYIAAHGVAITEGINLKCPRLNWYHYVYCRLNNGWVYHYTGSNGTWQSTGRQLAAGEGDN